MAGYCLNNPNSVRFCTANIRMGAHWFKWLIGPDSTEKQSRSGDRQCDTFDIQIGRLLDKQNDYGGTTAKNNPLNPFKKIISTK
jgi:hypothetical protein